MIIMTVASREATTNIRIATRLALVVVLLI